MNLFSIRKCDCRPHQGNNWQRQCHKVVHHFGDRPYKPTSDLEGLSDMLNIIPVNHAFKAGEI